VLSITSPVAPKLLGAPFVADKNIVYYNLSIEHWKGSPYDKPEATETTTEKASNKKIRNQWSMKKRHGNALPSTATGLDICKQTWCCFLATQQVQTPLSIM